MIAASFEGEELLDNKYESQLQKLQIFVPSFHWYLCMSYLTFK